MRFLPLSTVGAWYKVQLDFKPPDAEGIAQFDVLQGGGYAMGAAELDAGAPALPFLPSNPLSGPDFVWGLLYFGIVLLLSVQRWPSWRPLAVISILASAVAVIYFSALYLEAHLKMLPSTATAVGYTAFYAYPKPGQAEAMMLALALGLIAVSAASFLVYNRGAAPQPLKAPAWTYGDGTFLAVSVFLFACAGLPHSIGAYQAALHVKHAVDFDSQNILFWNYLAAHGKLPFRDFWYPYGGSYNEILPLFPYIAYGWLERVLAFSVSAFSVYICVRRSRLAALSIWAVLFLMDSVGLFWPAAIWRYMLSASIVLFGAAALQERNRWMAASFGLWTAYVLAEELTQAVYAVPAVIFLYGLVLWRRRKDSSSHFPAALAATIGFMVGVSLYILLLALRGQLPGWLAFLQELPSASAYSGWPLNFGNLVAFPRDVQSLYFLTVVLLLAGGAIQAVASRFESPVLLAPLALGLVSSLHLQKEIVRPGMATQILPISTLGLLLLVAQQVLRAGRPRCVVLVAGYCGTVLLAVFFVCPPPARAQIRSTLDFWTGKAGDLAYTIAHAQEWAQARKHFFSSDALVYDGTAGSTFRRELFTAMGRDPDGDIFVLGDRADLYLLLDKPAPYFISFYNQSPIQSQRRTISWLQRHRPAFVFWDATARVFDQVPNVVRVPLLFRYMVSHYLPAGEVRNFQLLRSRRPEEAVDITYWRRMLGDTINLGYIPSLSLAGSSALPGGSVSDRYVAVDVHSPVQGRTDTLQLSISGQNLGIQFTERAGVSRYWINLERLPWMDLEAGLPTLLPPQRTGLAANLRLLAFRTDRLY